MQEGEPLSGALEHSSFNPHDHSRASSGNLPAANQSKASFEQQQQSMPKNGVTYDR